MVTNEDKEVKINVYDNIKYTKGNYFFNMKSTKLISIEQKRILSYCYH